MTYLILFLIVYMAYKMNRGGLFLYDSENALNLRRRKNFCIIAFLLLSFLLIVRNNYFGTDTQQYNFVYKHIKIFYKYSVKDLKLSDEWGFYSLLYYLKIWGCDFRVLLAISALSYIGAVSYLIYRYSENVLLSYFVFFFYGFWVFNTTMRQCFALTFVILAIICAIRNKLIPYCVLIILAIMFHASAIVCIPIYWVLKMKFNKKNIIVFVALIIAISVLASTIFYSVSELVGKDYKETATSGYVRTLLMIVILLVGVMHRKQLSEYSRKWMLLMLMALCLQPIAQFNPALMRVNHYYYFFSVLLIPCVVSRAQFAKKLTTAFFILYGLYGFTLGSYRAGIRIYPYVYMWEDYFDENPRYKPSDFDY